MTAEELRATLREQPFRPFRIVLSDGSTYDIRHPDLLWVGLFSAYVGLTGQPGQTLFERSVKVDLMHITSLVPLEAPSSSGGNGTTSA